MAILFQDGFEAPTGLGQWTVRTYGNGLSPTLNTNPSYVKAGLQSIRFFSDMQGATPFLESISALQRTGVNARDLYVRGWFYLAQGLSGLGSYDRMGIIYILNSAGRTICNISARREALAPVRWALWCATDNVGSGTHHFGVSASVDTTPRWVCIEVHFNADLGLFEVWVTDNNVTTKEVTWTNTPPTGGFNAADRVQIGADRPASSGAGPPTGQYVAEVYGDEVAYGDAYIGPGNLPPSTLSINTSPELNVPVYIDGSFIGNTPIAVSIQGGTHTVRVESEVTR